MNRKEFGELVSALRQDMDWTQFQLAEYANVDEPVVSQIERGVKKHFEPELLFQLANVFQLTTLERREFFLAASGLDQKQIVRQVSAATNTDVFNARKVLDKMIELTGQVRLPAFLCDVYSDVIAANKTIVSFFKVPQAYMEDANRVPGGYNTTRFNFGKDLVARNNIVDNWDNYALNSMRSFRENSLRYRAKPYFKYLMKVFRNPIEYPLFDRYWKMVSSVEQDKEANADYFSLHHDEFGDIKYTSSSTVSITSFGELFLVQYLPLDARTSQIFEDLTQQAGPGVVQFAPWPVKTFPHST
ncbi:MAG: helix-turn-helix domain-containing protein [Anaerolineae bacterium]|nr:helix-turn-helix domain-containing protein [Anaerolineae bacterium]MCI0614579.1 helix-turn-helix domain-containing protein [bacterium]